MNLKNALLFLYGIVVDIVVAGLIFVMLVVLLFSFVDVVAATYRLYPMLKGATFEDADFRVLVENVLNVFIVIELFGTFAEYVRRKSIHISGLLDVAVVFTLREILVRLYAQRFSINDLIGLCIIVLILVIARSITGHFPPRQRNWAETP